MDKREQAEQLTRYMANFVDHIGKVLPDDIIAKLDELAEKEDSPLSRVIYSTMKRNQKLAKELNRPSCQDTGVLQFWVKCGASFADRGAGRTFKGSGGESYLPGPSSPQQCGNL